MVPPVAALEAVPAAVPDRASPEDEARAAAGALLRRYALPDRLTLIRSGSNVVFRLEAPTMVVRCSPPGSLFDPSPYITVAASEAGLPVSPPSAPPATIDGWNVTLWPYLSDRIIAHADRWQLLGGIVRRVHEQLDPADIPSLPDAVDAAERRCLARLDGSPAAAILAERVRRAAAAIRASEYTPVVVHGDSRPANLVGAYLIDWDQCGHGPALLDAAQAEVWARWFGEPDAADRFHAGYRNYQETSELFDACISLVELSCVSWVIEAARTRPYLNVEAAYRTRCLLDPTTPPDRPWWNG